MNIQSDAQPYWRELRCDVGRGCGIECVISHDAPTAGFCTLSLHDALPILEDRQAGDGLGAGEAGDGSAGGGDRKSTRLNSSHGYISYAVFRLQKKKKQDDDRHETDGVTVA